MEVLNGPVMAASAKACHAANSGSSERGFRYKLNIDSGSI